MNTPEGRAKAVETNKKKDPNYYKKIGSRGGKNSTHRPMSDPKVASDLAKKSWENSKAPRNPAGRRGEEQNDGSKTDV